jgi:N-methylhydantoinase A/oxoprolinase/acetone carboxylase beta subunit
MGHDAHGSEITPLDLEELRRLVREVDPHIHAYAVTARFSVRNPSHETAARDLIRAITDNPLTCSHELSSRLDGPKIAITALLNTRLIPLSNELIESVTTAMSERGITAPLSVMRSNGTVVAADLACEQSRQFSPVRPQAWWRARTSARTTPA